MLSEISNDGSRNVGDVTAEVDRLNAWLTSQSLQLKQVINLQRHPKDHFCFLSSQARFVQDEYKNYLRKQWPPVIVCFGMTNV